MKVKVFREDGYWTAHVEDDWGKEKQIHRIVPDSHRFLAVIKAMQETYPDQKIWIDKNISPNPWVFIGIENLQFFGMTPIYEDIDKMLLYGEEKKICNLCKGDAWYNSSVNCFQCRNCRAHESMVDRGRFFKLSKWATKKL